ncbi:hypothetical protein FHR51_000691 [Xanthomonas arboricola]|nr:hypothetical protein [Xanthomonas cannabis]
MGMAANREQVRFAGSGEPLSKELPFAMDGDGFAPAIG